MRMIRGYSIPPPSAADGAYGFYEDACYSGGCVGNGSAYAASPVDVPYWGMNGVMSPVPALSGYYGEDAPVAPADAHPSVVVGVLGGILGYAVASKLTNSTALQLLAGAAAFAVVNKSKPTSGPVSGFGLTNLDAGPMARMARSVRAPAPTLDMPRSTPVVQPAPSNTASVTGTTIERFMASRQLGPKTDAAIAAGMRSSIVPNRPFLPALPSLPPPAPAPSPVSVAAPPAPDLASALRTGTKTPVRERLITSSGGSPSMLPSGGGGGAPAMNSGGGGSTTPAEEVVTQQDVKTVQAVESAPKPKLNPALLAGLGWAALKFLAVM